MDLAHVGTSGEGNTISSPSTVGPTKRPSGAPRWGFTWNNYPEDWVAQLARVLDGEVGWIGVPEIAPTTLTPHIQGYVEFKKRVRPAGYKGLPKEIHWGDANSKPARGTRTENILYCVKDGTEGKAGTFRIPRTMIFPEMDKDWELEILELIKEEPDDRTIYWYYGEGNIGKTTFTKYLIEKHGAVMVSGKGADVRNAVCTYLKDTGSFPELVVFPIPRSYDTQYLSYEALENVKDMCFYSGKYEGGQVCGPCPHLFVFSNEQPDISKISSDRWKIKCID
tara:strand:- start:150 stop:989 length:840 start_codon:yes stop_codon:yes gene_type:complete